ncbi:hypothetical protein R3P38DRAFT_2507461 [Favolaschia claudopus]|uniref:Uncharacterized protein n=1 Tax=Favolaschia claudopus TaxID=2862362 RepID=A0AAW0D463_9AGAR
MGASLSTKSVPDWQTACASTFNCSSDGLVDINGQPISCNVSVINSTLAPEVWGITYQACVAHCGMDKIKQSIEFSAAAIPLTTWLLPWLALIAQLPFEAEGWMDILSACLCLGSPALAVYSLALTAFNRGYISRSFRRLKHIAEIETRPEYRYMAGRVDAVAFLLREVQQCPMRANQRNGDLANLLVLNDQERQIFWKHVAKDLRNTRRGFTYSFAAQVVLAFITYLISFIAAVHDSLGSTEVGLQFASSTVWSWMFPVVFGYIRVGSQCKAGAIQEALVDNASYPERDQDGAAETSFAFQRGLRPNADMFPPLSHEERTLTDDSRENYYHGITPSTENFALNDLQPHEPLLLQVPHPSGSTRSPVYSSEDITTPVSPIIHLDRALPLTTWWGFDVRGDEHREGPIFNYARVLTWFAFVGHIEHALDTCLENFKDRMPIPMTTENAGECCGFRPARKDLAAFMAWGKIPHSALKRMGLAALVAFFVQWGTTGAAIFVAYHTPAVGIGCRSGSYLVYGLAATASWILLVFSNLVSHALMQRVELDKATRMAVCFLGGLAVTSRFIGKVIAISNAAWLIASTVLEDIGFFETCWCQTNAFQFGHDGWTSIFKGSADLRDAASGNWIGGFIWSTGVCIFTAGIFAYGPN